jgi:carboxynorspermidine decarboxylase
MPHAMKPPATPYYLIDERRLRENLRTMAALRAESGAKLLLALKCFSTWCVFPLMREYLDGTTSSSLPEARLGHEQFGGETHAYSVAWTAAEVRAAARFADKVIFNSLSQWRELRRWTGKVSAGLRINPGFSHSHFDLADPARRHSRLGERSVTAVRRAVKEGGIDGLMFHFNCENDDLGALAAQVARISRDWAPILDRMAWVSLGGGIYFSQPGYPRDRLAALLKDFARRHGVQVYLEPGEAAISGAAELVCTVLDVVRRDGLDIAIVDASTEAHMLDLLIYRQAAKLAEPGPGRRRVMIAGRSCLAGDVFGTYRIGCQLKVGDPVRFADAAGYTMVKKNWFNGLPMPAIVVRRLDGRTETVRQFTYEDFKSSLS